ncbi:hypothetical protein PanWU01x14_175310, partial [Parasponia andersonii]
AEYIATTEAIKEAIWLKGLLEEINILRADTVLFSDSQSSIQLCKNPVFHERIKHIDVRYHFIRDILDSGLIILKKVMTDDNAADKATKVLPLIKFKHCLNLFHMVQG